MGICQNTQRSDALGRNEYEKGRGWLARPAAQRRFLRTNDPATRGAQRAGLDQRAGSGGIGLGQ